MKNNPHKMKYLLIMTPIKKSNNICNLPETIIL